MLVSSSSVPRFLPQGLLPFVTSQQTPRHYTIGEVSLGFLQHRPPHPNGLTTLGTGDEGFYKIFPSVPSVSQRRDNNVQRIVKYGGAKGDRPAGRSARAIPPVVHGSRNLRGKRVKPSNDGGRSLWCYNAAPAAGYGWG